VTLVIEGEVASRKELGFTELAALPRQVADLAALVPGKQGGAVWLDAVLAAAGANAGAKFATLVADDGAFAVSVPLDAVRTNAVVAYRLGDAPLPDKQGGPLRFFVVDAKACGADSGVDACANVKRLSRIRLTAAREPDVGHDHS
jgi:DMSO/TMAO reductase YedYZ molybdopterin-dependent catalytic subunit